jgi:tetratricopeptide (TPR) repeat protein
MNWLRLITVQVVLLSAAVCFAAEPNSQSEKEKTAVSRETAQDWIQVGISQSKKGLYEQAEKSFLAAREYQEYLTAEEDKQLEGHIANAHQAVLERHSVLEYIKKAKELLVQGQPVKARAHYEKVRKSPYLTEQERKQIDQEIKNVDVNLDKQRKEITEIYNRSVQLYRAGEIEKAREGFVEVARYGLLVVPQGQTAEDYLIQIDSILTEQLKGTSGSNASPPPRSSVAMPSAKEDTMQKNANQPTLPEVEVVLLKPGPDKPPVEKQGDRKLEARQMQEETVDVTAVAEPPSQTEMSSAGAQGVAPERKVEAEPDKDARVKIIRTYTKAVVEDAAAKVGYHISRGELDKAIAVVRTATQTVKENRFLIGDELFAQYSVRLKQLADRIVKVRKAS